MSGSDLVIDHVIEKYNSYRRELFVWNDEHVLQSFWSAECIPGTNRLERIVSVLPTNSPEKVLLIGLDTGVVDKVSESGSEELNRFSSMESLSEQHRLIEYDNWINGFRSINSIVRSREGIFDASAAGLFNTFTGEQVFPGYVTSATIYDDRLCVVPMGLTSAQGSFASLKSNGMTQGSLVDVATGEELVKSFAVFDRKTQTKPDYLIAGDRLYVASGKSPNISVSVKELPSLKPVSEHSFKKHVMFAEYEDKVYQLCQTNDDRFGVYGYNEDSMIFESNDNELITSILSSERLLVSVTDLEKGGSYVKDAHTGEVLYSEEPSEEFPEVKLKLHAICFTW